MSRRTSYRGRQLQRGYELECLRNHWEGVSDAAIERAREGRNWWCVDCAADTLAGGLRCMDCFVVRESMRESRKVPA